MGPESEKSQMNNRAIRKHLDQNGAKAIEKLYRIKNTDLEAPNLERD